jgi:hypothetical protein
VCGRRSQLFVLVFFRLFGDLLGDKLFSFRDLFTYVELDVISKLLKLENSLIQLSLLLSEEFLELVSELRLDLSLHQINIVFEEAKLAVDII